MVGIAVALSFSGGGFFQGKILKKESHLVVSTSSSPAAQTVAIGSKDVLVASWDFSANSDVNLDELLIYLKGIFSGDPVTVAKLNIDGKELAVGYFKNSKVNFNNLDFVIKKGETKNVVLLVDINNQLNSGGQLIFTLENVKYTDMNTAEQYSKSYSLSGPTVGLVKNSK